MRFSVPQFIEIEDKIIGPLTFKQFVYVSGGGGLCFIIYNFIPSFIIAMFFIVPIALFSLALAFYKVNGKAFIIIVEAALRYVFKEKLYLWKKEDRATRENIAVIKVKDASYVPKLSESKLKDLSWSLDVLDVTRGPREE